MARSNITDTSVDAVDDGGSVLLSLVMGEQLEFPVNLNFLSKVSGTYIFEAVAIEGENDGTGSVPTQANQTDPVKDTFVVRLPTDQGIWDSLTSYVVGDFVLAGGNYYLLNGTATVGLSPSLDTDNWELFTPNRVYIQVPSSLGTTYDIQPGVNKPVYAFFELSVQEPLGALYQRTWKPVRGLIEIKYSPTALVP